MADHVELVGDGEVDYARRWRTVSAVPPRSARARRSSLTVKRTGLQPVRRPRRRPADHLRQLVPTRPTRIPARSVRGNTPGPHRRDLSWSPGLPANRSVTPGNNVLRKISSWPAGTCGEVVSERSNEHTQGSRYSSTGVPTVTITKSQRPTAAGSLESVSRPAWSRRSKHYFAPAFEKGHLPGRNLCGASLVGVEQADGATGLRQHDAQRQPDVPAPPQTMEIDGAISAAS